MFISIASVVLGRRFGPPKNFGVVPPMAASVPVLQLPLSSSLKNRSPSTSAKPSVGGDTCPAVTNTGSSDRVPLCCSFLRCFPPPEGRSRDSCAQVLYALRVLHAHGLCDSALQTIHHSVVMAKLCYASRAWECFANATDLNKIQSFINKTKRDGYCSPDLPDFENLCTSMNGDLFNKVLNVPTHVLHPLLPPPNSTQPYALRTRAHNRTLPHRKSHLVDCNFIIRMLYWNAY